MNNPITTDAPKPVSVSGNAVRDMTKHLREWSGWSDVRLIFGPTNPTISPYATADPIGHVVTANIDLLLLNPHRVLNTINPFRLRQEAILTGALLHEAGHARYTKWVPRTAEGLGEFKHSDGATPTKAVIELARIMEESRVESRIAAEINTVGAAGLDWTMRASAAYLLPMTELSADPDMALMQLIQSWALRAGRQIGLAAVLPTYTAGEWVNEFTSLVYNAIVQHIAVIDPSNINAYHTADTVMDALRSMTYCTDDTGTTMIDSARVVLDILFPETDEPPMPSPGCGSGVSGEPESEEKSGGSGSNGADEPESSDEEGASGDAPAPEPGEEGEGGPEEGDEGSEAESDESETGSGEAEDYPGLTNAQANALADLQAALEDVESAAEAAAGNEAQAKASEVKVPSVSYGTSGSGVPGGAWRIPTPEERETAKNAHKFLRDLINPSESSRTHLTETPSATVDGAALAAWRASGQVTDPMFFIRTRRETAPTPPIKIAVLVDISGSMDVMQTPSALLSWALSSAAIDLRNFAGRGRQIESTLIHWGSDAKVIQPNGALLPGIREVECNHPSTVAMGDALELVEQQLPGFFDVAESPENRLLVQFTDWKMSAYTAGPRVAQAMEAGVNMISLVPPGWTPRWAALDDVMRQCPIKRGLNTVIKYDPASPEAVWDETAKALGFRR